MLKREGPVTFDGEHYQLPLRGGAGLGKPLKLITEPAALPRPDLPRRRGTEEHRDGDRAVRRLAAALLLAVPPEVYAESLRGAKPGFEIACPVTVNVNDDLATALLPVKYMLAFYIGGMGAKKKNFHANLVRRMGYGDAVDTIQELFLAGRRDEAAAAVPDEFADEISLVGPKERIRERLAGVEAERGDDDARRDRRRRGAARAGRGGGVRRADGSHP